MLLLVIPHFDMDESGCASKVELSIPDEENDSNIDYQDPCESNL